MPTGSFTCADPDDPDNCVKSEPVSQFSGDTDEVRTHRHTQGATTAGCTNPLRATGGRAEPPRRVAGHAVHRQRPLGRALGGRRALHLQRGLPRPGPRRRPLSAAIERGAAQARKRWRAAHVCVASSGELVRAARTVVDGGETDHAVLVIIK